MGVPRHSLIAIGAGFGALLLAGCGHAGTSGLTATASAPALAAAATTTVGAKPTRLDLLFDNAYLGSATYTLRCAPPGGTLPNAAAACARLASDPTVLTRPIAPGQGSGEAGTDTFTGPPGSSWTIRVTGTLNGVDVDAKQAGLWSPRYAPVLGVLGLDREQVIGRMGRGIIALYAPPAAAGGGGRPAYWVEILGPLWSATLASQSQATTIATPPGRVTVLVSHDHQFPSSRILCRTSFAQPRDALTRIRVGFDAGGRCQIPRPSIAKLPPGSTVPPA